MTKNISAFGSVTAIVLALSVAPALAQGRGDAGAAQGRGASTAAKPQTPPTPPTTAATHLAAQPQLSAKLEPLLPAGTNLQTAATGFKSLGAFVSAVHVSKNLDIPFVDLKAKVTGPKAESLGKAIHELKPAANADDEVKKANDQAKQDQSGKGL